MNGHALKAPREAERILGQLFKIGSSCEVLVKEDKAFLNDGWLNLGKVNLYPENRHDDSAILDGLRRGAFEWSLPSVEQVETSLVELLGIDDKTKASAKLRRIIDSIAAIGVRAGLVYPHFDPQSLEMMPFRRSTTVVADTSGAIQGALDFVARHLHPAARIKVPAIVQMEIVNFADRFLSCRRATKVRRPDLLIDHLRSQGGQRVLLRLELSADTEVERTFLLGDPLRSAFQKDSDPELSELNLSVEIKGYADRLILEAARQHQAQANFGHKVQLLTSDQGLARMALAEGIAPLYFSSVVGADFLGRCVTGVTLSPFSGSLREISLASVLWEFATAFGCIRLMSEDGEHSIEISAFGEALSWSPYQSHGDLLWCTNTEFSVPVPREDVQSIEDVHNGGVAVDANGSEGLKPRPETSKDAASTNGADHPTKKQSERGSAQALSVFRPNVQKLFQLVDALDDRQDLKVDEVLGVIGAKSIDEYRRFLASGALITVENGRLCAAPALRDVAIALRTQDMSTLRAGLKCVPSYRALSDAISSTAVGTPVNLDAFKRGMTTYTVLAECTLLGASIHGKGLFPTPNEPSPKEFAQIARDRFKELDNGYGLIATGAWLERLAERDGIHPEIARRLLEDASAKGLLTRTTEGSTIETSFDDHVVHVLRQKSGKTIVEPVGLYRGDYLIPDKSSVSLRIEVQQR
ncbi:hypothetical protein [Peteryoungia algae]|uniref:PIN domain-containing protein n=1 Tax=Peteryoungia algae TaxID=2919917 RepID=A0ABT0CXD0_9HYPH|nr:hypothetical protein [Rhizobium sp. SSM4.3]MCJ8237800.1 hypothetical protein [Rhizobium sp. SSM4.3]